MLSYYNFRDLANGSIEDRAKHLYDSKEFETSHQSVAAMGDTTAPSAEDGDRLGQHFVAFVKGKNGHLYELEGSRVSCYNTFMSTILYFVELADPST